jgi:site-specific DNA-methyltransferase (adenine-specific)
MVYIQSEMDSIIHSDARNLPEVVESGSIDLTITSPPYYDAVDYDSHLKGKDYFRDDEVASDGLSSYLQTQQEIFESVMTCTRPGGYVAIVIGMVKSSEGLIPLPHRFASIMDEMEWNFADRIVWHKVTGGSRRFGVTIQHPKPTYYYPNRMHEEIQIWRRGSRNHPTEQNDEIIMSDYVKREVANDVWHIAPVPPNKENHPCPFPEELAHRLIRLYCPSEGLVADPMCGSGTVLKIANALDRNYVGTDARQDYVEIAKNRVTEDYDRRQQLIPEFDRSTVDGP